MKREKLGPLIYKKLITAKNLTKPQVKTNKNGFKTVTTQTKKNLPILWHHNFTGSTKLMTFNLSYYIDTYKPMTFRLKWDRKKKTAVPFATIPQRC